MTFDANLTFEEHIWSKVNIANAIMGLIRRSFSYLDAYFFKKLYVTFVRPRLEYAQSVWAPHLKKYVDMLKKVQIRATIEFILFPENTSVERSPKFGCECHNAQQL